MSSSDAAGIRYEIVVGGPTWSRLHRHLIRAGSTSKFGANEQMALVLCSPNVSNGRTVLIVREVLLADASDLDQQSPGAISPTAHFVSQALTRCRTEGWGLIEVHSHPFDATDSVTFSGIDWSNDRLKLPRLASHLTFHATMVVGQTSLDAHVYDKASNQIVPVDLLRIVGRTASDGPVYSRIVPTSAGEQPATRVAGDPCFGRFDRQEPLLGKSLQGDLTRLVVGIVGLGGLGSFVAMELAHLGVGNLILVDGDVVEESNLNRLIGAPSASVGLPKVDVYADLIGDVSPAVVVTAIAAPMIDRVSVAALKSADVLIGCLDSHGARLTLNQLAAQYLIPYIDTGSGVRLEPDISSLVMGGQVQLVLPGLGCLQCRGFIDSWKAAIDLAPAHQHRQLLELGYGTGEPAPSVIHLNGIVASLAINEFVKMHMGEDTRFSSNGIVTYEALGNRLLSIDTPYRPSCVSCGDGSLAATGDLVAIEAANESRVTETATPQNAGTLDITNTLSS